MAELERRLRAAQLAGNDANTGAATADLAAAHVRHVTEALLCIKCPAGHPFTEFYNCFMVTCHCGIAFCAYCLAEVEEDTGHAHVARCPENANKGRGVFGTPAQFNAHQAAKAQSSIRAYLFAIADVEVRRQAAIQLRPHLVDRGEGAPDIDLGLKLSDLAAGEGEAAEAERWRKEAVAATAVAAETRRRAEEEAERWRKEGEAAAAAAAAASRKAEGEAERWRKEAEAAVAAERFAEEEAERWRKEGEAVAAAAALAVMHKAAEGVVRWETTSGSASDAAAKRWGLGEEAAVALRAKRAEEAAAARRKAEGLAEWRMKEALATASAAASAAAILSAGGVAAAKRTEAERRRNGGALDSEVRIALGCYYDEFTSLRANLESGTSGMSADFDDMSFSDVGARAVAAALPSGGSSITTLWMQSEWAPRVSHKV